jgi:nucleotide-binding universal stress UspA family protein
MSEHIGDSEAPVLLVAYDGSPMSEAQLHLACRAANDIGGIVRLLYVVEVSQYLPLDAALTSQQQHQADEIMDRGEEIVRGYSVRFQSEIDVTRSGSVGEAVIADAGECRARTIFIGLRDRHRPGTNLVLSGTVRYILQHAQCPVQIGYLPSHLSENASRL